MFCCRRSSISSAVSLFSPSRTAACKHNQQQKHIVNNNDNNNNNTELGRPYCANLPFVNIETQPWPPRNYTRENDVCVVGNVAGDIKQLNNASISYRPLLALGHLGTVLRIAKLEEQGGAFISSLGGFSWWLLKRGCYSVAVQRFPGLTQVRIA